MLPHPFERYIKSCQYALYASRIILIPIPLNPITNKLNGKIQFINHKIYSSTSNIQGSVVSAIGRGIEAILSAIFNVIMTIVDVIVMVWYLPPNPYYHAYAYLTHRSSSLSWMLSSTFSAATAADRGAGECAPEPLGSADVAPIRHATIWHDTRIYSLPVQPFYSFFLSLTTEDIWRRWH